MKQLEATLASCAQPAHYVRCVRPNAAKRADRFDAALVLRQLRASGIMDLVKIRALGSPDLSLSNLLKNLLGFVSMHAARNFAWSLSMTF